MKNITLLFAVLAALSMQFAYGQDTAAPSVYEPRNLVELRGSSTEYRYVDYMHTFKTTFLGCRIVTDDFYVGGNEFNEGNIGLGLELKPAQSLILVPMLYLVIGAKPAESGSKIGLIGIFEHGPWKGQFFLADLIHSPSLFSRENSPNYFLLDGGDLTHSLPHKFDAGISTGFVHQSGKWNPQYGPVVRYRNWSISYRFGEGGREFRVGKFFTF